jgi:ring-1,2-phenylacetyl-CoA epoxidase subunit PaaE
MRRFHPLRIVGKHQETPDSIVFTLSVPDEIAESYRYTQGQHLPLSASIGGKILRRTYSICSSVADNTLRLGMRIQDGGVFSNYAAENLDVGDVLEAMPPYGHFNVPLDENEQRNYAAFVAGSGVTPILSIIKTTLETEQRSRFVVFYGNRTRASTMFVEELSALKNRYGPRLSLHFIMSQEPTEIRIYEGRLDRDKATALHRAFLAQLEIDHVFLCGPNPMIDELTSTLVGLGYSPDSIHSERFRAGLKGEQAATRRKSQAPTDGTEVVVIVDGQRQRFHMAKDDESLLDAALRNGIELPYSCKGGVCSTCRCLLKQGEVDIAVNYALEPWELEKGFILTCQSTPKTKSLEISYDET